MSLRILIIFEKKAIQIKLRHIVQDLSQKERFNTYCESNIDVIPSRKGVKKAIQKGELMLNGKKAEGGRWLDNGDEITWVDLELTPPKVYRLKLDIVFEDEDLAVIVKPAGITVSGNAFKTIQNALQYNLAESPKLDKLPWPLPTHRLDNQTSGLLLVAKTKTARIKIGQAFEKKEIEKVYHAVVIGKTKENGTIHSLINDKKALSEFKRLQTIPSLKNDFLTLLELYPKTGRTHQLRIHCAEMGNPILGDKLYGLPHLILKHKGLFLSAVGLAFQHPISNQPMSFSIPTPEKFTTRMANEKRRFTSKKKPGNSE